MEGLGFVSRPLGLSAGRGVENAVCRRTSCGPRVARVVRMSMEEEEEEKKNPLAMVQDLISAFQRLVGVEGPSDDSLLYLGEEGFEPLFEEEAPTVLVVGATGEVGRIIVRKLLLRGYKVRVLVRDLFSSTLDLLGTGCGYVMGDVNDMNTLLEAVSGVDKVICALRARDPSEAQEVEMNGVKNLVRAYHDTRHADYGRAEATKLTLFKFEREKDFTRWTTDREDFEPELGRKPASVSLWMSPKKKAVFSGRVSSIPSRKVLRLACHWFWDVSTMFPLHCRPLYIAVPSAVLTISFLLDDSLSGRVGVEIMCCVCLGLVVRQRFSTLTMVTERCLVVSSSSTCEAFPDLSCAVLVTESSIVWYSVPALETRRAWCTKRFSAHGRRSG